MAFTGTYMLMHVHWHTGESTHKEIWKHVPDPIKFAKRKTIAYMKMS